MNYLIQQAKDFARNEEGATAIEYGMLAALISVVIIGSVMTIGESLGTAFGTISDKLSGKK
jgi:pilus assembly protein Flp/PilA